MLKTHPAELAQLSRQWYTALRAYLLIYLTHRLENFAALLRLGDDKPAILTNP